VTLITFADGVWQDSTELDKAEHHPASLDGGGQQVWSLDIAGGPTEALAAEFMKFRLTNPLSDTSGLVSPRL
jgi:hypothetical protein